MSKIGKTVLIILAILLAVLCVAYIFVDFIADIVWFKEVGYLSVFFTEIRTKLLLGVPAFAISTIVASLLLKILKAAYLKKNDLSLDDSGKKKVRRIGILLSVIFGVLFTYTCVSTLWMEILKFNNAASFDIQDPLFGHDISFYLFKLDFLKGLASSLTSALGILFLAIALYYILLTGFSDAEVSFEEPEHEDVPPEPEFDTPDFDDMSSMGRFAQMFNNVREKREAGIHKRKVAHAGTKTKFSAILGVAANELSVLGVLFFLSVAVRFYLQQFDLLYGGTGVAYGAGYTDVTVTLNLYRALMVLAVVSAVMLIVAIKKRSIVKGLLFPVIMVVLSIVSTPIAGFVQNMVVEPDELNKESKYLDNNIQFTRLAYNLQNIEIKDYTPENKLSKAVVLNNMETFSNIRINDFEPAEQFYNQTQSIRTYYTFNDVDVDRYYVNGEYTQVFLSAREIDQSEVDDSWLIRHLKYTHGYGLTLSRVDRITSSGQPDMLIDSIPPVSEVPEIKIQRPEIYYGESTDNYVITNTGEAEFDYPSGESNVYCEYEGTGGIKLSFGKRLLFAIRERSLKLLISSNITSESRILINRNILDRVTKIAPFLAYDEDPYVVTVDGKIYWIIDAYTYSTKYPYSEPYDTDTDVNYIRNSVKVVVDAYNGSVDFYLVDDKDPAVLTLANIYPELFKSFDQMPESLRAHVQYPNTLFNIQAYVYTKYHMTGVEVFYQNEDVWAISNEQYGQETVQMTPNYFIMKLPGEDEAEFVSTIPYTPAGKANLTGILMARSDGENYGEIVLYRMPKDRIIYGAAQIEAQINQDAEISKEFSLWNNSGSNYSRGNMFVIPVEGSLLYVEPIYLEASTGSLPEVKRVIMYYGDRVAYEPTLAKALDSLFGAGAGDPLNTPNPIEEGKKAAAELLEKIEQGIAEDDVVIDVGGGEEGGNAGKDKLAQLANDAYDKAIAALQTGDWASYGKYMDKLEDYLRQLVSNTPAETSGDIPEDLGGSETQEGTDAAGSENLV